MAGNIEVTQDDSGRYGVRNATQKGRGRCSHLWRNVGRAPDYAGQRCVLWRCDYCGKEHETFADCEPAGGRKAKVTVAGLAWRKDPPDAEGMWLGGYRLGRGIEICVIEADQLASPIKAWEKRHDVWYGPIPWPTEEGH